MKSEVGGIAPQPGGSQQPSFAAREAGRLPALHLLLALTSLVGWYSARLSQPQAAWIFIAQFGVPLALLAFVLACPAAYRRRAHLMTAALHVVLAGSSQVASVSTLAERAAASGLGGDGPQAMLLWMAMLCAASGVISGVACLLAFQLPPVAMAASILAWAAVAASGNSRVCGSALVAHPAAAQRLGALYRMLEPLVAPLEPILLAAGVGRHHPARRCHCVLAALQFWAVGVLPAAVAARTAASRYTAWLSQQRWAERQRRREQAEAWGFGFKEPSSSSTSCRCSDCGTSSDGSEDGERVHPPAGGGALPCLELSAMQVPPPLLTSLLAQAASRPAPGAGHHPEDWQYRAAQRLLCALRPTRWALAAAALAAAAGTAWHRRVFP